MGQGCANARKDSEINLEGVETLVKLAKQASLFIHSDDSSVIRTPLLKVKSNVWLKLENFQTSGSFKYRGAYLFSKLYSQDKFVVASTGNFAKAMSAATSSQSNKESEIYARQKQDEYVTPTAGNDEEQEAPPNLDSRLIVFAPKNASRAKLKGIDSQIMFHGVDCLESEIKAQEFAQHQKYRYASPYNCFEMVAAACTIGQEILEDFNLQKKELDYVFVSVGGGGLVGGIAFYLKYMKSLKVKIIGVQPKVNAAMYHLVKRRQDFLLSETLSDGTAGGVEEKSITIELCKRLIDDWVLVSEEDIKRAQQKILIEQKIIVEGAAALAYAGQQQYIIGDCNAVVVICGSNVDPSTIL